jgi:hypothetical protein
MNEQNNSAPLVRSEGSAQKIENTVTSNTPISEGNKMTEQVQHNTESDSWTNNENHSQRESYDVYDEMMKEHYAPRSVEYSVNERVINKNEDKYGNEQSDYSDFTSCWKTETASCPQFWVTHHIQQGRAVTGAVFKGGEDGKGYKDAANWLSAQLVFIDIDNKSGDYFSVDDCKSHPFFLEYGNILYLTPSYKDTHHRFRVVFALPYALTDAKQYSIVCEYISQQLGGVDPSSHSIARGFFGNNGQPGYGSIHEEESDDIYESIICCSEKFKYLPERLMIDARDWKADQVEQKAKKVRELHQNSLNDKEKETIAISLLQALSAAGKIRVKGENTYDDCEIVWNVLANEFGSYGGELADTYWMPSGEYRSDDGKVETIDNQKKVDSFLGGKNAGDRTLASLIWLVKTHFELDWQSPIKRKPKFSLYEFFKDNSYSSNTPIERLEEIAANLKSLELYAYLGSVDFEDEIGTTYNRIAADLKVDAKTASTIWEKAVAEENSPIMESLSVEGALRFFMGKDDWNDVALAKEVNRLVRVFEVHPAYVSQQANNIKKEFAKAERSAQEITRIKDLVEHKKLINSMDWAYIWGKDFAAMLEHGVKDLTVPHFMLIHAYMSAMTSIVGNEITLSPKPGLNRSFNLFLCSVASSSRRKTPTANKALRYIRRLQEGVEEAYNIKKEEIDRQEKIFKCMPPEERRQMLMEGKDPDTAKKELGNPRQFLFENGSAESLLKLLSKQPAKSSLLYYSDELKGWFDGMNQHKGGKGNDLSIFISLFSGAAEGKKNYADGSTLEFGKQLLSIFGNLQPEFLRECFGKVSGKVDPQGLRARFLMGIDVSESGTQMNCRNTTDITPAMTYRLDSLKETLEKRPVDFEEDWSTLHFTEEALTRFEASCNEFLALGQEEGKHNGYQALNSFLGKVDSHLMLLTMALHFNDCAELGFFTQEVGLDTLERAIAFFRFYLSCFEVVTSTIDSSESETEKAITNAVEKCMAQGSLKTGEVRTQRWKGKKLSTDHAIKMFKQIATNFPGFEFISQSGTLKYSEA